VTTLSLVFGAALLAVPRPNMAALRLGSLVDARGLAFRRSDADAPSRARGLSRVFVQRALLHPSRIVVCTAGGLIGIGLRPAAASAVALVGAIVLGTGLRSISSRRGRRDDGALLHALTILESELVTGSREDAALRAAAAVAGRTGPLLREAAARAAFGDDVAEVLERSALLIPLAAAWRVRWACGAPLADVVAQVARDVELRRRRSVAVSTALAGPRSSSALMATLPVLGIGLGTVMGARPLAFLFGSANGSVVLLIGVGLDVLGWLWTGVMARRAES
jgi:tight adherence protein B